MPDDRDVELCKRCGARIRWVSTAHGRPMPINLEPHPRGNLRVTASGVVRVVRKDDGPLYITHFATCGEKPMAEQVPSIGRVVHVKWSDGMLWPNNQPVAMADVTGVGSATVINVRVIVDGPPGMDSWQTSIPLEGTQAAGYVGCVWFWPPRV